MAGIPRISAHHLLLQLLVAAAYGFFTCVGAATTQSNEQQHLRQNQHERELNLSLSTDKTKHCEHIIKAKKCITRCTITTSIYQGDTLLEKKSKVTDEECTSFDLGNVMGGGYGSHHTSDGDTPMPTPFPTIDFAHSASWGGSYDKCDASATWRGAFYNGRMSSSSSKDAVHYDWTYYSHGGKSAKRTKSSKVGKGGKSKSTKANKAGKSSSSDSSGSHSRSSKSNKAAKESRRELNEWSGAAPTICISKSPTKSNPQTKPTRRPTHKPIKNDIMLEWNLVVLKANILDHNNPFSPDPSKRKLRYHYNHGYNNDITVGFEGGDEPSITQGPPASARAKAMIHMAIFEAYNCVTGKYQLYYADKKPINCNGASMEVAVAQAAHGVMTGVDDYSGLYVHNQTIIDFVDNALDITLSRELDALAKARGIKAGHEVARRVLNDRYDDGYSPDNPYLLDEEYKSTGEPGNHKVDPENPNQGYLSPGAAQMRAIGMASEELKKFKAPEPPGLVVSEEGYISFFPDDPDYVASLKQVKALGAFRGGSTYDPVPTDDETYIIGNYWSANGSPKTGTPTALYNDIARKIAIERGNSVEENMLLFTVLNMALADTGMSTWDSKFFYKMWRPIVAIREHPGGGPMHDETWKPLGASRSNPYPGEKNFSPPFPGHTSGHAAFGCAVFQTLANFYGTYDVSFTYTSPEWNGETRDQFNRQRPCLERSYPSLIDVMAENAASRVYNGVHFDFEGSMGCESGMNIASYIFENKFLPTDSYGKRRQAVSTNQIPRVIKEKLNNSQTSGYEADMCYVTPDYPVH